jgi:hypothetical protein
MPEAPTRRRLTRSIVAVLLVLGAVGLVSCSSGDDESQQQIDDLQSELDATQAELETTQADLADTQAELATTQEELMSTQAKLKTANADLAETQAELLDAQAQLAKVGELVLTDGTYNGQVLAAKASPYRVILFDAAGLWRVAQVSDDATITAGGKDLTLSQFGKLLQSTDPDDIRSVNGDYKVAVKKGIVTSIRKSQS